VNPNNIDLIVINRYKIKLEWYFGGTRLVHQGISYYEVDDYRIILSVLLVKLQHGNAKEDAPQQLLGRVTCDTNHSDCPLSETTKPFNFI
jgi:hypothetical protein